MLPIDHHKKQAKQFLRWHRDGYVPVAALIRNGLARFAGLSDDAILRSTFKLCDAQELIARQHGHDSWIALVKGACHMPSHPETARPAILSVEPQLFVSDMAAALAFYTDTLGFSVAFTHGEPIFYAQVARDAARLNLRWVGGPIFAEGFRDRETDALAATLTLDDAKPLFLEYQDAGAPFHQRLRTEPWGARTFIVRDPDGNLLAFAGR